MRLLRALSLGTLLLAACAWAQPCLIDYALVASTPPLNGTYACGQTVTFCLTINSWNTTNANWLHGIVPSFGAGWDLSTLSPDPAPVPCGAGGGTWGWYASVQGTSAWATGPQGPGYFYDLNNDGDPGNNFGDFCTGPWTFCWTISVLSGPACVNGLDLSVAVNTFGDSETGSWGGSGCTGDVNVLSTPAVIQSCAANAGIGGPLDLCSTSSAQDLFATLTGGPDAGGTWTGPAGAPHSGILDPTVDLPGNYTYTVGTIVPPCSSSSIVGVSIAPQPDAGGSSNIVLCSSDAAADLFTTLGGTPDGGGTWTGPAGAASGLFDPSIDPTGVYTYSIAATAPCLVANAYVTVNVTASPSAGGNGMLNVCSNNAAMPLVNALTGSPSPGGSWTNPLGVPVGSIYTPGADTPGAYTYTVQGIAPCLNSSATVTVTEQQQPNAGVAVPLSLCTTSPPMALIDALGGSADPNGTWTDPNGLPFAGQLFPSTAQAGDYTYTLDGVVPCSDATAVLPVSIFQQPSAGSAAAIALCIGSPPVDLFSSLGGTPDPGGFWLDPLGQPTVALFSPATSTPGDYTYSLVADAPCTNASATVTVSVSVQPNAGTDAVLNICSDAIPTALLPLLGPNAMPGGSWTDPNGLASTGTFIPGQGSDGAYSYTLPGVPPCSSSSATVTVTTTTAGNAGTGVPLALCSSDPAADLFASLSGAPDASGTWTGPGGGPFIGPLDPMTAVPGAYQYTIPASGSCPAVSTIVDVSIDAAPYAGNDASLELCADANAVAMSTLIGGNAGGTWNGPEGPATDLFVPGSHLPGTYTYTVSGTGACTGVQDQATVDAVVHSLPEPFFTMDTTSGCVPFQVHFVNGDPASTQTGVWSFGDGGTSTDASDTWHQYTEGGVFDVAFEVTDEHGCIGVVQTNGAITASAGPAAEFYALPLRVSERDPVTQVTHVPVALTNYSWSIDDVLVDTSGVFFWAFDPPTIGDHEICLVATDSLGCSNDQCVRVVVDDELTIYVANAFSPNGDDRNETFRPSIIGEDEDKYEFMVFDRWGLLVFRTTDPQEGWNGGMDNAGAPLPPDVYVWTLKAKDGFTPQKADLIGTVTIVK